MGSRNRSTPSDGLSDSSSTVSSAWASEYTGPKLFVKPSTKSNRGIVTNAINTVLAGAVNSETKRKVLEVIITLFCYLFQIFIIQHKLDLIRTEMVISSVRNWVNKFRSNLLLT